MTEEVSYSVAGANLRKRRRRDDTSANVRKRRRNEVPAFVDTADLSRFFPGKIKKKEYREYFGLEHADYLSLEHGKFVMDRRLKELNFRLSDMKSPADGSCMFHAILDQIQNNPSLSSYAESHWELCWKIVSEGYDKFLKTDLLCWPDDPLVGSKKEWRKKMLDPNEWGDEVVLNIASNLLEVDIKIIPAFQESSCNRLITRVSTPRLRMMSSSIFPSFSLL